MDNPTKNLIPRSAVEYICRKETVSTNPDDFTHSEMFIRYLDHDAISSFGRWQWANGFNTALVSVKCGIDKIPTIEPERKRGEWLDTETSYADVVRQKCRCSVCKRLSPRPLGEFCRWCGADMRGEGEQDG